MAVQSDIGLIDELVRLRAELRRREREAADKELQLQRYAADLRETFKQERARAQELRRSYMATVRALSNAVEARDAYTGHCLTGARPVGGSDGARDRANRGTAARLGEALAAADVPHDIKEYPDAGHAFMNDHDGAGDHNPVIFLVMGKFAGPSGYHETSARDARNRVAGFFSRHLR